MASNDVSLRELRIIVTGNASAGLREISRNLASITGTAKSLFSSIRGLQGAFAGYFAVLKVGQLATMADEMQNLFNRIKVLNGSTTETTYVFEELLVRASRTKTSISDLANIYATLSATLRSTGISSRLLLDVTETLQNTFRLSGTTGELAAQGTLQLAQGLALGTLRGQDLRSVLQSNVFYGDLLAKQLNITRDKLYKFAETGKITAKDALGALLNNMDAINNQAKGLSATFGSVLSASLNSFRVSLFNIVQNNDLVTKFQDFIDFIGNKMTLALSVLAAGIAFIVVTSIPSLIAGLKSIFTIGRVLLAENPYTAFFGLLLVAIVTLNDNLDQFKYRLGLAYLEYEKFTARLLLYSAKYPNIATALGFTPASEDEIQSAISSLRQTKAQIESLRLTYENKKKYGDVKDGTTTGGDSNGAKKYLDSLPTAAGKLSTVRGELAKLNALFRDGKIDQDEYTDRLSSFSLEKLKIEFRDGRIDLEKFKQGLIDIDRTDLTRTFDQGGLSVQEFTTKIRDLDIEALNLKLRNGKVTLAQYNEEVLKLKDTFDLNGFQIVASGAQSYLSSVGTFATGIAGAIEGTFKKLEDALVDFIKTGKYNFADFAQSILDDLNRIIIRSLVISPIARGLLNTVGGADASQITGGQSGNTGLLGVDTNLNPRQFASGGIVTNSTLFKYGNNKTGVAGEAGAEAILPLTRHSNGDLGVKAAASPVYVNITNTADVAVEQTTSTNQNGDRVIGILVKQKVAEGFANGSFDKVLQSTYGLRRAGN